MKYAKHIVFFLLINLIIVFLTIFLGNVTRKLELSNNKKLENIEKLEEQLKVNKIEYSFYNNADYLKKLHRIYFSHEENQDLKKWSNNCNTLKKYLESNNLRFCLFNPYMDFYLIDELIVNNNLNGNGLGSFSFNGKLTTSRDNLSIEGGISGITVNTPSFGGTQIESIESIKKYAPQTYASQNRAVTSTDYEYIIPKIYPEAESVSVFGGEELSPPQFGKVFASIKPINGAYLSNLVKDNLKREIKKYSVGGVSLEITDLKYLYIEALVNVYYNENNLD